MSKLASQVKDAVLVSATILLGTSCGQFNTRARPLYPAPVRPADQVATLSGPVGAVDDVDVSRQGNLFSLLPGCHVVSLRKQVSEGGVGGAWSIDLPHTVYAFRMQPGRIYEIQILRQSAGGAGSAVTTVGNATSGGGVKIEAVERDGNGRPVGTVAPVRANAEIEACQGSDESRGLKKE
jgi:hypothetical protein